MLPTNNTSLYLCNNFQYSRFHIISYALPCHAKLLQSCPTLCDPMDRSPPGSSVLLGFAQQECWIGLLCPPPGDLPNPGIESMSLKSLALAGGFLPLAPSGKPHYII